MESQEGELPWGQRKPWGAVPVPYRVTSPGNVLFLLIQRLWSLDELDEQRQILPFVVLLFSALFRSTFQMHYSTVLNTLQVSSVQFSRSVISDSQRPHEPQHARPPCPSLTPGVHPNPYPLSQWCHPTISPSVSPFSSCPQSLPASRSFQMSQLFASGGQSIADDTTLMAESEELKTSWWKWKRRVKKVA